MRWGHGLILAIFVVVGLSGCAPSGLDRGSQPPAMGSNSVIETARAQIGTPYRAAGASPATGFDCSGFVQWVFARNGVRLPRQTSDQLRACHPVAWGDLRAGDLVFFTPSFRTSSLHVGIFDGRGSFIHSPSPGGRVRAESIMAPYWRTAYYKACRVLP
jgi:cell wall-associated NlpC family hydrolase